MSANKPPPHSKRMRVDEIRPGPIRRTGLNPTLLARLRAISNQIGEIDGMTFEERELSFCRDVHPDRELAVWESIATAYAAFTATRELPDAAKREAFGLLLMRSMTATHADVLAAHPPKALTKDEALELLRSYG